MLVLTRKAGQSVIIGDGIEVTVLSVAGDKVRIGVAAERVGDDYSIELIVQFPAPEPVVVPEPEPPVAYAPVEEPVLVEEPEAEEASLCLLPDRSRLLLDHFAAQFLLLLRLRSDAHEVDERESESHHHHHVDLVLLIYIQVLSIRYCSSCLRAIWWG